MSAQRQACNQRIYQSDNWSDKVLAIVSDRSTELYTNRYERLLLLSSSVMWSDWNEQTQKYVESVWLFRFGGVQQTCLVLTELAK